MYLLVTEIPPVNVLGFPERVVGHYDYVKLFKDGAVGKQQER